MPQTIADGLQRIINAKTDIDGAIEAKDGTVTKGLENSDEDIMTIPTGATSYSPLTDKPAIDNHTLMPGNNTSSDLGLQTKLTFDSAPTENSTNPVTSDGVYTALSGKQATIDSSHKLSADNVDDTNATNKFATAAQLAQISTNQTNIGKVQTQANWNTNNGVKNFATINDFTYTGYYKDILVDGSLTGNVVVYIGNIISTDTDANQCAVLFIYTDNTSSPIHLVNRGTSSSFSVDLETNVLKSIRIYPSDNYVHSPGDTVTVTNLMVCPKSLYDADPTYEPYALPNTTLTQGVIWNTNNGVKNILDWTAATREDVNGVDFIVDEYNKTVTVNGTCTAATGGSSTFVIRTVTGTENVGNLFKDCVLMGVPENANGNVYMSIELRTSPYTLYAMDSGYGMSINEIPANVGILIFIRVPSGKTVDNLVIKPMICHRSVLDKSYQPSALSNVMITPELIKLVDSGPKNLIEQSSGSDTRWINVDCDLEPGTYVVSFGSITTTHTADSIQVTFFDSNWANCGVNDSVVQMNLIDKFCVIRTVKRAAHLRIYASPTTITDKVVTFTNLMVCTKSAWDVSQKFVPYRPSYISASDYATQNTGGTVRMWTTTSGGETTLHISNEAP